MADDELLLSRLLERMLQDEGMLVYRAASGSEALSLLAQHSIDVVVTDILMPGNGNTVAKHVQDHYPACGVVLMTGGSAADAAREALGSEQVSLLLKPFEADELVLKVFRSAEYARARARLERGSGRP
ncbi:MAG: response regulator [Myxococcota bacterium]